MRNITEINKRIKQLRKECKIIEIIARIVDEKPELKITYNQLKIKDFFVHLDSGEDTISSLRLSWSSRKKRIRNLRKLIKKRERGVL